jgi:hypothetical protein
MILKLRKLDEISATLNKILQKDIDVKLAYRMRKITLKIMDEFKHVQDASRDLYKKYGEEAKTPDGKPMGKYTIPAKNKDAFEKDINALMDTEVDLGGEKIPFACLESMDKLSAVDIANLDSIVEPPEAPVKPIKK